MSRKKTYTDAGQAKFCADIAAYFDTDIVNRKMIEDYIASFNPRLPYPVFLTTTAKHRAGWGQYRVRSTSSIVEPVEPKSTPAVVVEPTIQPVAEAVSMALGAATVVAMGSRVKTALNVTDSFIPAVDPTYVPFGFYNDLKDIVKSGIFYPVYITGLSGNGKTKMVEQVCAALGREYIRVNITKETDESDLIGGYELIDGNTIRREGPVIVAMRRGALLLLDETDYGSERLLCLQPILEGIGYHDKKTGEFIKPHTGFNIMATANTKGKGNDSGMFIGANTLNEAFLERFAITVEQEYPSQAVEKKILTKVFSSLNVNDDVFIEHLANWADGVRKAYVDGSIDDVISTRRLVHISRAYSIFNNRMKAINLCLNRFSEETKTTLLDFYSKIDQNAEGSQKTGNTENVATDDDDDDFYNGVIAVSGVQPIAAPTGVVTAVPSPFGQAIPINQGSVGSSASQQVQDALRAYAQTVNQQAGNNNVSQHSNLGAVDPNIIAYPFGPAAILNAVNVYRTPVVVDGVASYGSNVIVRSHGYKTEIDRNTNKFTLLQIVGDHDVMFSQNVPKTDERDPNYVPF